MVLSRPAKAAMLFGLAVLCGCAEDKGLVYASGTGPGTDEGIRQSVLAYWRHDHPDISPPDVAVSQGVVDLTGAVATSQLRVDIVRDAWQPAAVHQVVIELEVTNPVQGARKDEATTMKLRNQLTFDPNVNSTHYSIETIGGTVYLMGEERDETELAKVQKIIASAAARSKIVSYVRPMQSGQ